MLADFANVGRQLALLALEAAETRAVEMLATYLRTRLGQTVDGKRIGFDQPPESITG